MKSFQKFLLEQSATQFTHHFENGPKKAHVVSMKFSNGDEEHTAHIPGERMTVHSSFEKAKKRVEMHGFKFSHTEET